MIAIIPARGGSKGVLKKNIRMLGGKPLIHWTIKAALEAESIDRTILSTDDLEIADLCRATGIEIPFMRPKKLAHDDSLAIDNYIYTMEKLINEYHYNKDEFVVLLPTTPFRNSNDIENAAEIFYKKKADSVISCSELEHPISWIYSINKFGLMEKIKENELINRQNDEIAYKPNGGIYIFKYSLLKSVNKYYTDNTYAYVMPRERSIDIDTEDDFQYAEFILKKDY